MSIFEVQAPFHNRRHPKCRACQYYGPDPENGEYIFGAECMDKSAPIRNRFRDHNDKACSHFRLADWCQVKPQGE